MFRSTDFSFTSSINGDFAPDIDDDDDDDDNDVVVVVAAVAGVVVVGAAAVTSLKSLSLLSGSVFLASDTVFFADVDCSGCSDDGKLLDGPSSVLDVVGGTFGADDDDDDEGDVEDEADDEADDTDCSGELSFRFFGGDSSGT